MLHQELISLDLPGFVTVTMTEASTSHNETRIPNITISLCSTTFLSYRAGFTSFLESNQLLRLNTQIEGSINLAPFRRDANDVIC